MLIKLTMYKTKLKIKISKLKNKHIKIKLTVILNKIINKIFKLNKNKKQTKIFNNKNQIMHKDLILHY